MVVRGHYGGSIRAAGTAMEGQQWLYQPSIKSAGLVSSSSTQRGSTGCRLSTPSHPEPVTTLTMANCSIGFYKLSSKYLGMPNISAAAGIPVCKLFMNQCLNSQGTLLSINYFSPSSCGLGAALFYFRTTACNLSLVSRLKGHHSDPGRQSGVNQGIRAQSYLQVSGHGSALWGHGTGFWGTQNVSCLQPLCSQADARNQGL